MFGNISLKEVGHIEEAMTVTTGFKNNAMKFQYCVKMSERLMHNIYCFYMDERSNMVFWLYPE